MFTNGTIRFAEKPVTERNEFGEVVQTSQQWSAPLPCAVKTNTDNRIGNYEGGEFRSASFAVLMEGEVQVTADRVCLTRFGEDLGEHRVISAEYLSTFDKTQILV